MTSLLVGADSVTALRVSIVGIQIVYFRVLVCDTVTSTPSSNTPYVTRFVLAVLPSITIATWPPVTFRNRKRPVWSVSVSLFPTRSVTPSSGIPSSRRTCPEMAVTPGGAWSGGSFLNGESVGSVVGFWPVPNIPVSPPELKPTVVKEKLTVATGAPESVLRPFAVTV